MLHVLFDRTRPKRVAYNDGNLIRQEWIGLDEKHQNHGRNGHEGGKGESFKNEADSPWPISLAGGGACRPFGASDEMVVTHVWSLSLSG